jgi:hypothetical protein
MAKKTDRHVSNDGKEIPVFYRITNAKVPSSSMTSKWTTI